MPNLDNVFEEAFPVLNLPATPLRIVTEGGVRRVYDRLRSRFVALTPEEWVRQHFTSWLVDGLGYPAGLTANEMGLTLNRTRRRADTVVFDRSGAVLMIVEYKAPSVEITSAVFDQIVRYNMVLRARYLVVSNGMRHYCCEIDYKAASYRFLSAVPRYSEIGG